MSSFSLGRAARILRVSPRRLRYWETTALVNPRGEPGFDFRDLVSMKAVLNLLDRGIPLQRIRKSVEILRGRLPELEEPLGALRLWDEASTRVVVRIDGVLHEPDGQMVLDLDPSQSSEVAIDSAPRSGPGRRERALEVFERGCQLDTDPSSYAGAISSYRLAIEIDPDFADPHCNLGAIFYNQGRRDLARGCFERCLELDSRHLESHFNLGNLLEEEDCSEIALRHYRMALEIDPLYADLHINLALLYEKLKLARRAKEHWRRYLQLDVTGTWADVARQRLESD